MKKKSISFILFIILITQVLQVLAAGGTHSGSELDCPLAIDSPTLYVDCAGNNVGIGTTTPDQKLEIANGGIQIGGTNGIGFGTEIPMDGNVVSDGAKIYRDNNYFAANLDALVIEKTDGNGANPDGGIVFTNKGNDNIREDALVIRGSGNIGVGKDPAAKLDVDGTIRAIELCDETGGNCKDISVGWSAGGGTQDLDSVLALGNDANGRNIIDVGNLHTTAGDGNGIKFWGGNANYAIYMSDADPDRGGVTTYSLTFKMNDQDTRGFRWCNQNECGMSLESLTGQWDLNVANDITLGGNIRGGGAGNSLRINTGNGYVDLGPQNTGWAHMYTDRPAFIFNQPVYTTGNAFSSYNTGNLNLQTGGTTRMTIVNSDGDVGIGTTGPSEDLHVYRPDSDVARIYATGSSQGGGMVYVGQSTSYGGGIAYDGDNNPDIVGASDRITFFRRTAGTDYPVISIVHNSDNVGIGTTTPNNLLHVAGSDIGIDIGAARHSGSSKAGLNIHDTADGGTYTNIQFAERAWGGTMGMLFNAFKSASVVNGGLSATGNTKYANSAGAYSGGAGMIQFTGNGGHMGFYVSPASTGQNTNIAWGSPVLNLHRGGSAEISGPLNVGASDSMSFLYHGGLTDSSNDVVLRCDGSNCHFWPWGTPTSNQRIYVGAATGVNFHVSGTLSKNSGSFIIDHPDDPENQVLRHSFVESPDMKNIYDGITILDEKGEAIISLPDYFESLNDEFRYQLTPIGSFSQVYVKEEIKNNQFVIASIDGAIDAGKKISWQVTGIRIDKFALDHPIIVEEEKSDDTPFPKGTCMYKPACQLDTLKK